MLVGFTANWNYTDCWWDTLPCLHICGVSPTLQVRHKGTTCRARSGFAAAWLLSRAAPLLVTSLGATPFLFPRSWWCVQTSLFGRMGTIGPGIATPKRLPCNSAGQGPDSARSSTYPVNGTIATNRQTQHPLVPLTTNRPSRRWHIRSQGHTPPSRSYLRGYPSCRGSTNG